MVSNPTDHHPPFPPAAALHEGASFQARLRTKTRKSRRMLCDELSKCTSAGLARGGQPASGRSLLTAGKGERKICASAEIARGGLKALPLGLPSLATQ
jgi:hypothetical protein